MIARLLTILLLIAQPIPAALGVCAPAFARWSDERKTDWIADQQEGPSDPPPMGDTPIGEYAGSATGPYLLDVCLITEKKLGSMGDPAIAMIDDREIRFCCMPCKPKF
ncbi:MAG: hypothetical protein QGG74_05720 [Phycisphaerales bacterium]|nr:hypothetical protein [Phycisphaerales bacterium]MDP6987525.1 hypothetical protein [Phycisphaerales bacterium]